jgi:hypothetical protein
MPLDHALVIEIKDLRQAITYVVAIVGVPVAFWKHSSEKRKERLTKEKEAFSVGNQRYAEFLQLLLTYDTYDMFDLAEKVKKLQPPLNKDQVKRLIIMAWMAAMLETAYVWYSYDPTPELKKQWKAWERYVEIWTARQDFRDAWPLLRDLYHDSFCSYVDAKVK